jgi:hypothetical protein
MISGRPFATRALGRVGQLAGTFGGPNTEHGRV